MVQLPLNGDQPTQSLPAEGHEKSPQAERLRPKSEIRRLSEAECYLQVKPGGGPSFERFLSDRTTPFQQFANGLHLFYKDLESGVRSGYLSINGDLQGQ